MFTLGEDTLELLIVLVLDVLLELERIQTVLPDIPESLLLIILPSLPCSVKQIFTSFTYFNLHKLTNTTYHHFLVSNMQDRSNMLINGKDDENTGSSSNQVHYVPFKVEFEGSANVSAKFSSKSTRIENSHPESNFDGEEFKNQFHGKPLNGKHLVIPDEYEGIIAIDAAKEPSVNNDKETKFRRVGGFSSLTYWNWDKPPSTMDAPVKLMDWLELSQKLHEPIEEDS